MGFYGILCHQIPGPEAMGIRAQNSGVPKAKWPQVKLRNWHAKKNWDCQQKAKWHSKSFFLISCPGDASTHELHGLCSIYRVKMNPGSCHKECNNVLSL